MRFKIRFNKTRGQAGRGTIDHAWRVFDESGKERVCKHVKINVPSWGEKDVNGEDWNIVAEGRIRIDKQTSTITIL